MVAVFRWAPLGAVFLACGSQPGPAPAPPTEPLPHAAAAPNVAPNGPPSSTAGTGSVPTVRMMAAVLSGEPGKEPAGRLDVALIQKATRVKYGAFRECFEAGLGRNRQLKGRISARFVIELDGTASNVSDGGSDLPDQDVIACVLRAFQDIRFPPPEGGTLMVVYPILLEPG